MYTEEYIRENTDEISWVAVSYYSKLSESFIKEFKDKVDWAQISISQKLTESFIKEFQNRVDWFYISNNQKLSENFIREFKNKVVWKNISYYQKLSELFIQEFENRVNWAEISCSQKLSENFIRKFQNNVEWSYISGSQKLSKSFIKEFKSKINVALQLKSHHNILSYQQKLVIARQYAEKHGLECNCKYLYAYRYHDNFNKGMYNKVISYDYKGEYTDWHCDLNPKVKNSFGLGIFQEGNVRVRIKIKDIGCWPNNTNKLRVWAFKII